MNRNTLATLYGIGRVRIAPGTVGSLVAATMAWGILHLPHGWEILAVTTLLVTLAGMVSADYYIKNHHTVRDPREIVIDEVVGQWLTYLIWYLLIAGASFNYQVTFSQLEVDVSLFYIALGFALFRCFDIVKPWPISWADRKLKGGFGVMFDDLLAAIPSGILLYLSYVYSPLLFGTLESVP